MTQTKQFDVTDRDIFYRRNRYQAPFASLRKLIWWLAALAILGGVAAALYHYELRPTQAQLPLQAAPTGEIQPAPTIAGEPTLRPPIPEARSHDGQAEALPTLDQSDKALEGLLTGIFGAKSFTEFFFSSDIVRRFVVTIDNLPRKRLPVQLRPVKPAAGRFLTTDSDAGVVIAAENDRRYSPYVLAAEAVDTKKLVAAYVLLYPLFQEEYEALGYPSGTFNDRLIEAIDDLLITPDVEGPVRLVQPRVMYQFADPDLEALSAGEKVMLRIGGGNAARIKTKLREIRRELNQTFLGN